LRPQRRVPTIAKSFVRLAAGRAIRRVMFVVDTSGIHFVPFFAPGHSDGERKPVVSDNRP
jgi:hypothetical protein